MSRAGERTHATGPPPPRRALTAAREPTRSPALGRAAVGVRSIAVQTLLEAGNAAVARVLDGGRATLAGPVPPPAFLRAVEASGRGRSLPEPLRDNAETHLRADLSPARMHVDQHAGEAARLIGARAFTVGADVYVPPRLYRPHEPDGRRLLVHELAHVAQAATAPAPAAWVADPDGPAEREAQSVAARAASDDHARVSRRTEPDAVHRDVDAGGVPAPSSVGGPAAGFAAAVAAQEWRRAAELWGPELAPLDEDAAVVRARALSPAARQGIRRECPPDAHRVRGVLLVAAYLDAVAQGDWRAAALHLNGLDEPGIGRYVNRLSAPQLTSLNGGAMQFSGASRLRLAAAIERRGVELGNAPGNALPARDMFEIWKRFWVERHNAAVADERHWRRVVHDRNPVQYAEHRWQFEQGQDDALGPEYRDATRRVQLSSNMMHLTEVLNWLQTHVDVGHHAVTLPEVNARAREIASGMQWYQRWMEPLLLAVLGGLSASPRARQPARGSVTAVAEVEPAAVPTPARAATRRPFLDAEQIRSMQARGVRVVTWRTFEPDVVQNQTIRPTGQTNPNFGDRISFGEGFRGFNYGPYCMVIERDLVPNLHYHSPGEFFSTAEVPASVGYWTTIEEVERALRRPQ